MVADLKAVDENIQKEKALVKKEKDTKLVGEFMAEVKDTAAKVPKVKALWNKLGMSQVDGDESFNKISVDMEAILKKSPVGDKSVKNAMAEVKV